jgi:hypothetical protein
MMRQSLSPRGESQEAQRDPQGKIPRATRQLPCFARRSARLPRAMLVADVCCSPSSAAARVGRAPLRPLIRARSSIARRSGGCATPVTTKGAQRVSKNQVSYAAGAR